MGTGEITCVFPFLLCWAPCMLLLQLRNPSGIRKPRKGSRMPFSPGNARLPQGVFPFYYSQLKLQSGKYVAILLLLELLSIRSLTSLCLSNLCFGMTAFFYS